MADSSDLSTQIYRDYQDMSGRRSTVETQWQEIAQRVCPDDVDSFSGSAHQRTEGEKRTQLLFDSTASIALSRFTSILDSMLTPRNSTWQRLVPSDPYLKKNREVMKWFEETTGILFKHRYAPTANFSAQNLLVYRSVGAYGPGVMYCDQIFGQKGLRYKNIPIGEVFFSENHQGTVDHLIRRFALTADQAIKMFSKEGDKLPDAIKTAKVNNRNRLFVFLHCVKPREDVDPNRADYKGMPFGAYYVSEEGKSLVREEGFQVFPYAVSRFTGTGYGRGAIADVLPAIKTLNEEKKTVLKQGHRAVDPVLLAHDDGVIDAFSLKPGAINAGGVSAEGRALVHALPVGNIAICKDLMDDERLVINDALLVSLFQILTESPGMTATEVLERIKEKGILMAPILGGQHPYLGQMTVREIDLLSMQGLLPPMPSILKEAEGEFTVEYDSPLSRAQRAEEASGLMRTIETVLNVVNITQNQEPLDHFNWDVIVPEVSDIQGVPMRWMRDPKIVAEIRASRQDQQETQEMIQAAPAAAAMQKADAVANKGRR